ncbi:hypothetical protein COW81_02990 [Candidatus Campbellbacteria bacterium CG22_combo_CG10-13_8_21_14_all_36_13]|uniref:Uncharacterized protein n=1 Tax=Candidatus Campbellbacteria bacterium CG22_combo_CG10-13_8_21_14_all_36_13 TaxID=1974529 RepID=A0A2H0DXN5_9BACT|nr:MAG: hypothetical protein COW81_02990 [Candidatus Campbellbacteria bacterium CG22_combo_CG10-13_8_21_14_all_36_13]
MRGISVGDWVVFRSEDRNQLRALFCLSDRDEPFFVVDIINVYSSKIDFSLNGREKLSFEDAYETRIIVETLRGRRLRGAEDDQWLPVEYFELVKSFR